MKPKLKLHLLSALLIVLNTAFAQRINESYCFAASDGLFENSDTTEQAPLAFTYTSKVIHQNGPASNRVNLVYAADGYTAADLVAFPAQVDKAINYLKTASMVTRPLPRYFKFLNVYRIDLESKESGLSIAPAFGQPKTTVVNNALGGTHDLDRLGWVDNTLAVKLYTEVQNKLGVKFNWRYVILNDDGYYNSGSEIVCFSFNNCKEIALHEGGHGFFGLADEYYTKGTTYTGSEPSEINATIDPSGKKWLHWKGYVDQDKNCGTMGVYEGARFFSNGLFRPSSNSKMGWTKDIAPVSYNAFCREKIILDIYSIVRPVDSFLDTLKQQVDPDSIWVKVIDPSVILVDWYVNDILIKKNGGSSLKKSEISSVPGTFKVRAHAYDEVVLHANSSNTNPDPLDLVRKDLYKLQQDVRWNVKILSPTDVEQNSIATFNVNFFQGYNDGTFTMTSENLPNEKCMLEVMNITGQIIYKEELQLNDTSYSKQFQLNGISQGIYLIKLSGKDVLINKKMMLK